MRRYTTSWFSHNLGMEMPLVAYGHAGFPLLMFPTAAADYLEYERFYLICDQGFYRERSDPGLFDQFCKPLQPAKQRIPSGVESRDADAIRQVHHGRGFAFDPQ